MCLFSCTLNPPHASSPSSHSQFPPDTCWTGCCCRLPQNDCFCLPLLSWHLQLCPQIITWVIHHFSPAKLSSLVTPSPVNNRVVLLSLVLDLSPCPGTWLKYHLGTAVSTIQATDWHRIWHPFALPHTFGGSQCVHHHCGDTDWAAAAKPSSELSDFCISKYWY